MFEINTDTVRRLAALAREIHAESVTPPVEEPGAVAVDWEFPAATTTESQPGVAEFRAIVADLEPDQQQQVVALMWLGRGDFEAEEWEEAVDLAEQRWSADSAAYLLGHPLLADELEAGLAAMGFEEVS